MRGCFVTAPAEKKARATFVPGKIGVTGWSVVRPPAKSADGTDPRPRPAIGSERRTAIEAKDAKFVRDEDMIDGQQKIGFCMP